MNTDFTLTACVDPDAISKVSRLFNASLDDIVAELLQNARRSGATKVSFSQYIDPEVGNVIAVVDNGPGLQAPDDLFQLGRSGWDVDISQAEDAAGMGFFALADRETRITAQKVGQHGSWILKAGPKAFGGKAAIEGSQGPTVPLTLDLSRFDAAPLITFTAAKETNYGTEADGRIPG